MKRQITEARVPARNPESGCHLPRKQTEEAIRCLRELDDSLTPGEALGKIKRWHAVEPMPEPSLGSTAWRRWAGWFMQEVHGGRKQRPVAQMGRDYRVRSA